MSKVIIEVKNLNFAYADKVEVLSDIEFLVNEGDFVALIGANGGGKTTLVRLILGLESINTAPNNKGEISIFGQPTKLGNYGGKIGYVPQRLAQSEVKMPITVEEIVAMGLVDEKNKKDVLSQVKNALSEVGLIDFEKRQFADLSGGQRQRVLIARALIGEPAILILDEPTIGIDEESQESFYILLKKLNMEKKITIFMISHDVETVINRSNLVLCLNKKLFIHKNNEQDRLVKKNSHLNYVKHEECQC